jgi:hypothetical protein
MLVIVGTCANAQGLIAAKPRRNTGANRPLILPAERLRRPLEDSIHNQPVIGRSPSTKIASRNEPNQWANRIPITVPSIRVAQRTRRPQTRTQLCPSPRQVGKDYPVKAVAQEESTSGCSSQKRLDGPKNPIGMGKIALCENAFNELPGCIGLNG